MGRVKAITRKLARKAINKRSPKAAPTPPKAEKKEKKKAMSEELDDLREQVERLTRENESLREQVEELGGEAEASEGGDADLPPKRRWTRGKLPGDKLIKTDNKTGKFEEITREEWDSLA